MLEQNGPDPDSLEILIDANTLVVDPPFENTEQLKGIWRHSTIGGLGVFAREIIRPNELIERCPLIPLDFRAKYIGDRMIWSNCVPRACECDECKKHGPQIYMVLGNGMLYNHQDTNNATIKFDYEKGFADVVALEIIQKNQEIFINYGPKFFNNVPKKVIKK